MHGARLILIVGLPGSGKTTRARQLEATLPAVRLSADDWMTALGTNLHAEQQRALVEQLQWRLAERLLALGNIVLIEWGTWGRSERDMLRLRARDLGAAVELHYLFAPVEELFRRVRRRAQEQPPITLEQMQGWASLFEAPDASEQALFDAPLRIADG